MKTLSSLSVAAGLAALLTTNAGAQRGAAADTAYDPVQTLVDRLDLEKYKNTIKGLAQFGDRRQGTKRNRDAVTWIEAQLKSYGCQNVERITYQYNPAAAGELVAAPVADAAAVTSPNGTGTRRQWSGRQPHLQRHARAAA